MTHTTRVILCVAAGIAAWFVFIRIATMSPVDDTAPGTPPTTTSVYYSSCKEARDAGAAPLIRGFPGYRDALDRDQDGIACTN